MSLELMMGASGHGKTHLLYKELIEQAALNPDQKYILLVPEQSSLQAQKDVVRMSEDGRIFNIDVLTFGRLAYRVFEELGVELNESIDDTGKNLIIRKIVEQVKDKMIIIKPSKKQGFINEVKSMISEFKQYGITPEELLKITEQIPLKDRLKQKLIDLYSIYLEFELFKEGKFVTAEDKPEELLKVLTKSRVVNNSIVAMDGYTGFTPVQYRLIETFLMQAKKVMITVTLPYDEDYNVIQGEEDLFYMSKTVIAKTGNIADRLGIKTHYKRIKTDMENYRFSKSEELNFLENNIFRFNGKTFAKQPRDIKIACMNTPLSELKYISALILQRIREDQLRFRDIAVVTGDLEAYGDEAMRIFTEAGIPAFIDRKRTIIDNPMVEYLRSILEIIRLDYSYETMFRFLKNGLGEFEQDSIDQLENYVLAYGIRGYQQWNHEFILKYASDEKNLEAINIIRTQVMDKIQLFSKDYKNTCSTAGEYVRKLYEFIETENLYEKMIALAEQLEEDKSDLKMLTKAVEYRQVYGNIIDLLDRIDGLLGEDVLELEEFIQILDEGFQEIQVGLIPPSVDCITMGDIERTRLEHVKVLFLIGVNEGLIPKMSQGGGVLSETERRILTENEIELAPDGREKVFIQNYYLYLNMTEPERALYFIYHRNNQKGEESKPSRIIHMIKSMYPGLQEETEGRLSLEDRLTNIKASIHLFTEEIGKQKIYDDAHLALLNYLLSKEESNKQLNQYITSYVTEEYVDKLTETAAKEIYKDMISSISRIETFAKCAFSHFARYGLELKERKIFEIGAADLGNVFHKALESISQDLLLESRTFADLEAEERVRLTEEAVQKAAIELKASFFTANNTNQYLLKRLVTITDKTIWALGEQMKVGELRPAMIESTFTKQLEETKLYGKIDRVDCYEDDESVYIRIIDYKSGKNDIDLNELYAGIKLQLMVYLKNVIEEQQELYPHKEIIPAGALYNRIDNPIIKYKMGKKPEEYQKDLLMEMCPSGFVGLESIDKMDHDFEKKSYAIPVKKDAKGKVPLSNKVFTKEQFELLTEYASNKMVDLEKEIKQGHVEVNPYEEACNYCPYSDICGFDAEKQQAKMRKIKKVTEEDDLWNYFGYQKLEKPEKENN